MKYCIQPIYTINQLKHHSTPDDVLHRVVLQLLYIGVHVLKGRYYHCGCYKIINNFALNY